jgi:PAS domain S-box-containing protein
LTDLLSCDGDSPLSEDRISGVSDVKTLANIPLSRDGKTIGSIGLVGHRAGLEQSRTVVEAVRTIGQVLASTTVRITEIETHKRRHDTLSELTTSLDIVTYRMSLPDGRYLHFGSDARKVLGYSSENFIKDPQFIKRILDPADHDYFKREWSKLMGAAADIPETYEYRVVDPEGGVRWIRQSNKIVRDNQGKPIIMEGLCRNITVEREYEEALIRTERRFQSITEHASDLVAILDVNGVFSYVSPSVTNMLGYAAVDVVGKSMTDFVIPEDHPIANEILAVALDSPGETYRVPDVRVLTRSGEQVWMEGFVSNLLLHPDVSGLVINCRNITERKHALEKLMESQNELEVRIERRTRELTDTNKRLTDERTTLRDRTVALREVLQQVEEGKQSLARQTQANVNKIAIPILESMEAIAGEPLCYQTRLLRSCLEDICCPLALALDKKLPSLSPREHEICQFVRNGLSSKEIAASFRTSEQTVLKQRKTIRRKLGLKHTKTNLASHLRTLSAT